MNKACWSKRFHMIAFIKICTRNWKQRSSCFFNRQEKKEQEEDTERKTRKHRSVDYHSKASRVHRLYLPVGFFIARTRSLTENESKNTDLHQWLIYLLPKPKPSISINLMLNCSYFDETESVSIHLEQKGVCSCILGIGKIYRIWNEKKSTICLNSLR